MGAYDPKPRTPLILCALVLAAPGLAACGDDDGATTASATTTSSTQPSSSTTTAGGDVPAAGDSEPSAGPREPPIGAVSPIEAAKAVLTSKGSPNQACDRYVTESFVETAYGGGANCIASRRRDALARSIVIGSVDAEGQQAHLVVVPKGGPYDGAKVEVEVIAEGSLYRVDALEADVPPGP